MTIFPVTRRTTIDDLEVGQGGWISIDELLLSRREDFWFVGPDASVEPLRLSQSDRFVTLTENGLELTTDSELEPTMPSIAPEQVIIESIRVIDEAAFTGLPGYRHLASSQAGLASFRG